MEGETLGLLPFHGTTNWFQRNAKYLVAGFILLPLVFIATAYVVNWSQAGEAARNTLRWSISSRTGDNRADTYSWQVSSNTAGGEVMETHRRRNPPTPPPEKSCDYSLCKSCSSIASYCDRQCTEIGGVKQCNCACPSVCEYNRQRTCPFAMTKNPTCSPENGGCYVQYEDTDSCQAVADNACSNSQLFYYKTCESTAQCSEYAFPCARRNNNCVPKCIHISDSKEKHCACWCPGALE